MNGTPHTHDLIVTTEHKSFHCRSVAFGHMNDHLTYHVIYGDTTIEVCTKKRFRGPIEKRLRAAALEAIKLHDEGSVKAARQDEEQVRLKAELGGLVDVAELPRDVWASESLRATKV